MKTVGIIGFNGFGELLATKLDGHVKVFVSSRDPKNVPKKWRATFQEATLCDYLILSIPLSAYPSVIGEVKKTILPQTVIVDVSSVKIKPVKLLKELLPDQQIVATHPLFGPQSAKNTLAGHTIVMCPDVSSPQPYKEVREFFVKLELIVSEMTPEKHDQEMAQVHALTFFVSRTLLNMGVHDSVLKTPTFSRILDLADLEKHHTNDLFRTIQLANPYARTTRLKFIATAEELNNSLSE